MATGPETSLTAPLDTRFFGHPRGLATLFFTEMWERFSYYGMRALLVLFMTDKIAHGGLGFNDSKAGAVYGLYTAMAYLLCLPGGWVADRLTGQRRFRPDPRLPPRSPSPRSAPGCVLHWTPWRQTRIRREAQGAH